MRALRGLVRLKSLIDGNSVKRQAASTLRCMQTLARVQSQIRSRRLRMTEENQALQRQLLLKKELDSLRVRFHSFFFDVILFDLGYKVNKIDIACFLSSVDERWEKNGMIVPRQRSKLKRAL